jgi:hypothetical protein
MWMGPNRSLDPRRKVAFLMEAIRAEVHAVCGAVISCADIMALATRDAVVAVRAVFRPSLLLANTSIMETFNTMLIYADWG